MTGDMTNSSYAVGALSVGTARVEVAEVKQSCWPVRKRRRKPCGRRQETVSAEVTELGLRRLKFSRIQFTQVDMRVETKYDADAKVKVIKKGNNLRTNLCTTL